jgi:hypothetical protein
VDPDPQHWFFKHLLRSHADHSHEQHTGTTSRDDQHKGEGGAAVSPPTCQPAGHHHDHHGHDHHDHDGPQGSLLCHEMIRVSTERNIFSLLLFLFDVFYACNFLSLRKGPLTFLFTGLGSA